MDETISNGTAKNPDVSSDRGAAAIKTQYHTTKEKFHEFIDSGWQRESAGKGNEETVPKGESPEDSLDQTCEPPEKKVKVEGPAEDCKGKQDKKRARGQFKSRPHMKPHSYDDMRLCPSIIQERTTSCFFGERCRFFHDVAEYMSLKPADVGEHCHLFSTFGKCPYGVTCRYSKAHVDGSFKNLVNEELLTKTEGRPTVKNSLDKGLQKRLRKRQVPFGASEVYLRTIGKGADQGGCKKNQADNQAETCSNGEAPTAGGAAPNRTMAGAAPADTVGSTATGVIRAGAEGLGAGGADCEETTSCRELADVNSSEMSPDSSGQNAPVKTTGPLTDADVIKLRPCEKKQVDFRNKLYLAPLTTCGNLPFRRVCKRFGADVTCGEMAMCTNLLQGQSSEWALLKRHESEDIFGVQLEGCFPDTMTKCAELLNSNIDVDFVDINSGCPIDLVYKKGGGCGLMTRTNKFEKIVRGMNSVLDVPLTVKIRTGVQDKVNIAHKLIPELKNWGISMITLHGRSREQRYTKMADWEYIDFCSKLASPVPLFGNGDILSYEDAMKARETGVSGIMLGRGALIKPWIFTEIKEQRHWDISSNERLDILKDFTRFGLEQWGSDTQGLEKTRTFLLEWLSFMCRYIPVGLLEHMPQKINERPPYYMGRDYLETLMASQHVGDWVKISEMILGPVPRNFSFLPKHKANAYK
uniref:tRNA-dihydrouridine(47) synthase [NAD(P)(+)] n=1 Tax=Paramormyrops kingsleyae TaxID=1676925 RepID=A0A3B3TFK2_9TELE|nr:tRNA-dihydrouridine(47) synthase [NAD(P)(+)]-like [Paramormyrops kingsleyae]XP_023683670.1 tRNA-dihydrouridine(47) synthase [NAD(P)(+)]-like [Paramormyrops kingsleyae]XP_023683671.1 tRNA-dihydrouridine(47) synthase [NAD(P)(+)]-like [Paramormyrops kingsleyae]